MCLSTRNIFIKSTNQYNDIEVTIESQRESYQHTSSEDVYIYERDFFIIRKTLNNQSNPQPKS